MWLFKERYGNEYNYYLNLSNNKDDENDQNEQKDHIVNTLKDLYQNGDE